MSSQNLVDERRGFGGCWQYAFGLLPEIDLSQDFIQLGGLIVGQNIDSFNFDRHLSPVASFGLRVGCKLSELMLIIDAIDYVGTSHFAMVRGQRGLAVELGTSSTIKLPVWHICGVEETNLFYAEPKKFALMISEAHSQLGIRKLESSKVLQESLVYVGALTKPCSCAGVTVMHNDFKAPTHINSDLTPLNAQNKFRHICDAASEWLPVVEGSTSATTTIDIPTTNIQFHTALKLKPRKEENPSPPTDGKSKQLRIYDKAKW